MLGQCGSIAQNNQFHTGTGDGYVHTAQVIEEANLTVFIGTHQTDKNHVTLLPLKAIHRIDGNQGAIRLEKASFLTS